MIEDASDSHRGRRGRHHDRHRCVNASDICDKAIETIVMIQGNDVAYRITGHLARALPAKLAIWDRCGGAAALGCADFAGVDLVRVDAKSTSAEHRVVMAADLAVVEATPRRCEGLGAMEIAAATGRGVLIVPSEAAGLLGTRVAVRWDGTRQAAFALRDALPLLRDAECIWVVDIEGRTRRDFASSDAARYLERHGFDAYELEAEGCCLADLVACENIDLLVAGAFPPHRFSSHIPEQLAEALHVPVLVSA